MSEAATTTTGERTTQDAPPVALSGIHHVTAIASDPSANLAFYTRVLAQRLVKKTVNFDDPTTYHFYFGVEDGRPGSILTFFPWPGARRGAHGSGQATVTSYAVPQGALVYWRDRLASLGVTLGETAERFGEPALPLLDPDGLRLELVEVPGIDSEPAWRGESDVPVDERWAIRGLRGVTLAVRESAATATFLTEVMGFERIAADGATIRHRIGAPAGSLATVLDLVPAEHPGRPGAGTVHHVAFRIRDDAAELAWQERLTELGSHVSPVMDRHYFHSIYFREPGGVLFEIATDPPGFTVDEPLASLGAELRLPPGLEATRARIEAALPELDP